MGADTLGDRQLWKATVPPMAPVGDLSTIPMYFQLFGDIFMCVHTSGIISYLGPKNLIVTVVLSDTIFDKNIKLLQHARFI